MRARHRHFNPCFAGATAVFDSRYIDGLSDGSTLETWTSRSGSNNLSQSDSSKRPTYETNEINGNPSVFWDGSNDDEMLFSSALAFSNNSFVIVYKNSDATNGSVVWCRNNNSNDWVYFATNSTTFDNTVSGQVSRTHNLGNVFLIASGTRTGSSAMTIWVNSIAGSTDSSSIPATWTTTGIGKYSAASTNWPFNTNGHLGLALLADVAWSDALRRRCEHAAAFSFKIACN